jgi:hypothetical protein
MRRFAAWPSDRPSEAPGMHHHNLHDLFFGVAHKELFEMPLPLLEIFLY